MATHKLKIIGESINDSVPSTKKLFDANDIEGILNLAKMQDQGGATYIDVNVGRRTPEFMADLVKKIQGVTLKPLSIDTPDFDIAKAGLEACKPGQVPVLNSISQLRMKMFDLYKIRPFMPILMVSERVANGQSAPNTTSEETHLTAKELVTAAHQVGITNDQCIIDVGIAPIATDSENMLKRVIDSLSLIHHDPFFKGVHCSVGLSNFSVMLPVKCADGSPVKGPLESAFLTLATPLGLDMVIGNVKRNYEVLSPDHKAMQCLGDAMQAGGFESIERVSQFYS